MRLLSIDPGYSVDNGTGAAVWVDGELVKATLFVADDTRQFEGRLSSLWAQAKTFVADLNVDEVVIERPKIYSFANQRADPEDIVRLSILTGLFTTLAEKARLVEAPSWKGQMPKEAVAKLVSTRLRETEKAALEESLEKVKKSVRHNVVDAIGLGLHALSRWPR